MEIKVTLRNFRSFADANPPTIHLRPGFTGFIGANNSGKSSLLKFFYEFRPLFDSFNQGIDVRALAPTGRHGGFSAQPTVLDQSEVFNNSNDRHMQIEVAIDTPLLPEIAPEIPFADRVVITVFRDSTNWSARIKNMDEKLKGKNDLRINDQILYADAAPVANLSRMFAAFRVLTDTLYIGPFRNAINIGANEKYFDLQVGQAFIGAWKWLKAGNRKQDNEACYRLTQDIRALFGFSSLEISAFPDDRSLQFLIDGRSFKLHEVGSGLAQFLMVLASAASRVPSYILIDEPELNLHPALQSKFLTTLGTYAKKGVLFATHSMGLARGCADYVYSVRKTSAESSSVCEFENTPGFAEFLGELGFSSYRELGYKKILFVEGKTEIKTFHEFLRKFDKDQEFVVLPLGGSQLINPHVEHELCEVKRLCENVFAIIDSERKNLGEELSAARTGFIESCAKASIMLKVLDRRAIENYLSEAAIKKVKGDNYRALTGFEERRAVSPMWSKAENWKIAREMSREEIEATDLGEFLSRI